MEGVRWPLKMRAFPPLLAALLASATLARAGVPAPGFTDTLVASGFSQPTGIAFLPDGRMLVTEKAGKLKLVDNGSTTTLVTLPVCSSSEMGLLGIAIDPGFTDSGRIFLYRTEATGGCASASGRSNEVVRVTMNADSTIDLGSMVVLLSGFRTDFGNHDGGGLRIGPDGSLWIGVGDTGRGDNQGCPGSSTNPYAQNLNALEGKILRVTLDGAVPADNPLVGQAGVREEIFAWGLRNPWRMDFDPLSGKLWVADVGDLAFEEIDIVGAGENYGWPACEANFPAGCNPGSYAAPIFSYSHGTGCPGEATLPALGTSITGGTFAGSAFLSAENAYVFADFTAGTIHLANPTAGRDGLLAPTTIVTDAGGIVDLVRGPDGAVYVTAFFDGEIRRIAATPAPAALLLSGKRLTLKVPANPATQRISVLSLDGASDLGAGNGSADDPVLHGGHLHLTTSAGCSGPCDLSRVLPQDPPAQTWSYIGAAGRNAGYRFAGRVAGEKIAVIVKPGKLVLVKVDGGLGIDLAQDPTTARIRLGFGEQPPLCLEFGGTQSFVAGRSWRAMDSSAPSACLSE